MALWWRATRFGSVLIGYAGERTPRPARLFFISAAVRGQTPQNQQRFTSSYEEVDAVAQSTSFQDGSSKSSQSFWDTSRTEDQSQALENPTYPRNFAGSESTRDGEGADATVVQQPLVEPPHLCSWHYDHVNTVKLIGVVGAQPVIKRLGGELVVAQVSLGIPTKAKQPSKQLSWIQVDFWGYEALQILHYVKAGTQLAVGGSLRKDTWQTGSGTTATQTKVVADYFMVVQPGIGTVVYSEDTAETPEVPSTQAPRARRSRSKSRAGPSGVARKVHDDWLADLNMTWGVVAAANGISPERAISHLVDCASSGIPTDLTRLTAQLQMSAEAESPWTSVEEIKAAVSRVQAAAEAESLPSSLDAIRMKPIRQMLLETPQTARKVESQEKGAGDKIGLAITYGQIKLVLADLRQELGLEAAAITPPLPIDRLKDPGNGPGVRF